MWHEILCSGKLFFPLSSFTYAVIYTKENYWEENQPGSVLVRLLSLRANTPSSYWKTQMDRHTFYCPQGNVAVQNRNNVSDTWQTNGFKMFLLQHHHRPPCSEDSLIKTERLPIEWQAQNSDNIEVASWGKYVEHILGSVSHRSVNVKHFLFPLCCVWH